MDIMKSLGTAMDDIVSVFSPEAAVKRRNWRIAYGGYEAATPSRKDLPFMNDGRAEQFNSASRTAVRARVRNIERNSDVASSILCTLESNIVGSKLNFQAASKDKAFNKVVEELFNEWQHSENCDITGAQNLTEITKMIVRRWVIDGGILITYCYDKKMPYGIQLQLREVDDLTTDNNPLLESGNMICNGIELTRYGKPVAYYLNQYTPGGIEDLAPERIEASRVDFLWTKQRPTQYREMSNLAKSAVRITDLEDYNDAVAFQQKTAACTSAFIETDNFNTAPGRPVNNDRGSKISDLQAGSIRYLKPGEKVKPFIPTGQAAEVENYIITQLRMISAGQGLSLESATRNVERVNYSSARQNMLADQKTYKDVREFLIEHFLRKMYKRFVQACYLMGKLDGTSFDINNPDYYKCKWLTEGMPWIDPLKEANANNIQLGNGGLSFQKFCADNGVDWRERLEEMKEVQDYCDELGVKLNYMATVESIVGNTEKGDDEDAEQKISKAAMRSANLEQDIDVENRKVRFCFMTEAPCDNWWIPEVCLCEKENADLTRFENGIAPVLFNHDRDKIIGKIDKIEFIDKRAYAEIILDDDEESEKVFKKIQSGSLRGVSVGYLRKQTTRVEADMEYLGVRYDERTDVTTLWELLEVSIVSIPADNDTGVGRELGEFEPTAVPQNNVKEINEMETKDQSIDVAAEREAARKAEAERTQTILGLCRDFNVTVEQQTKYLSENMTVDAVRASILDEMKAKSKPSSVQVLRDENEKLRDAYADAMCLRAGLELDKVADGARELCGMNVRAMAEEILEREGASHTRRMTGDELFERAMGSGAFQSIVDDFAHKTIARAYAEQPFIFKNFVSNGSNTNFQPNYRYEIGLSGLPKLMPAESADFEYDEMKDGKVMTQIHTYGKGVRFTREIFINDSLGAVQRAISLQVGGFRRLQEMMFFETLTGKVAFSSAKKNLVATNKNISAKAYNEAKQLMMKQKDLSDQGFIGVAPSYVLAPVEQEQEHLVLLQSGSNPAQNNPGVINPVRGSMTLFTSPYLTGNAYYLLAAPNQMDGIEFTTLNGVDTIQSRTVIPAAHLGMDIQYWCDFGFNVLSEKFAVKNPNA